MSEGIQETKEVIEAVGEVGALLTSHLKDGFQLGTDIVAFMADVIARPTVRAALEKAADNISKVPAEIKDVDASEGLQLAKASLEAGEKIINALKAV